MEQQIKEAAQWLKDNAGRIADFLAHSRNYRSFNLDLHHFKHSDNNDNKEIKMAVYDEEASTHKTQDITTIGFIKICGELTTRLLIQEEQKTQEAANNKIPDDINPTEEAMRADLIPGNPDEIDN